MAVCVRLCLKTRVSCCLVLKLSGYANVGYQHCRLFLCTCRKEYSPKSILWDPYPTEIMGFSTVMNQKENTWSALFSWLSWKLYYLPLLFSTGAAVPLQKDINEGNGTMQKMVSS